LEECECQLKAYAEFLANLEGQCGPLTGDDKIACEKAIKEQYQKALEDCSPEEPTECEKRFDEAYQVKLRECLANGGSQDNCEAEAKEFAAQILKECECQEKATAEYEAHKQKCDGLDDEVD
jgi:hypothetical protein